MSAYLVQSELAMRKFQKDRHFLVADSRGDGLRRKGVYFDLTSEVVIALVRTDLLPPPVPSKPLCVFPTRYVAKM